MDTKQILTDLRIERERIDRAISALEGLDGTGILKATTPGAQPAPVKTGRRRRMSAAARKKIAEAQRARWAKQKNAAPAKKASAKKAAPARHMSPATRKRLSILAKKRWAARKKAARV
jgi:hypothetical protein